MLVPYNLGKLWFSTQETTGAAASPFVAGAILTGVNAISHVTNGAILLFVLSAANPDLYIASRTLYSLAMAGNAPAIFKRTINRGAPVYALVISAVFRLLAFMNVSDIAAQVSSDSIKMSTIFGLMAWVSIFTTHIGWCCARRAQGLTDGQLPYFAPLGMYGSIGRCPDVLCHYGFTKNYEVFTADGNFAREGYKNFITGYIGIPVYLGLLLDHKLFIKNSEVKPTESDFLTGKAEIDSQEEEFVAAERAREVQGSQKKGFAWVYKYFQSWML